MNIDVNLPDSKKLRVIRDYPMAMLVFCLLIGFIVLAGWQYRADVRINDLQKEIKGYLKDDRSILIKSVDRNTETNLKVVEALIKLK